MLTMAKIGYARVSSKEQHLDRQLAVLKGVDKLFTDKLSGANTNRPELQKMLAYVREGDIVLVTELDRLGRNNQDLTKIMNTIQNKGATLDVLNLPSMTGIADPNLRINIKLKANVSGSLNGSNKGLPSLNSRVNIMVGNLNMPKMIPVYYMLLNFTRRA